MTVPPAAAWTGGRMTARATCVLAPNPGPMTLEGTNTWLLVEPGASLAVVVDPGPDLAAHHEAVLGAAEELGSHVGLVLLTHGHPDHAEGAATLADLAGQVACPGPRPGSPARLRGARRRRPGQRRRARPRGGGYAGPHGGLTVLPPRRRWRGPHRGHGPGPRHDRGGPPRRPARRLPGVAGAAARAGGGVRARARAARPRSGPAGPGRGGRGLPGAPRCSAWPRSRLRWTPVRTDARAVVASRSTRTWTRRCGRRPSSACGRSSPTSASG